MNRPGQRLANYNTLLAGIGAMICITALASLERFSGEGLLLMAPFGATMVIVFGLPDSPLAQPRNVILGHALTTFVGLSVLNLIGVTPWSLGLAVGLALMLMLLSKTTHPPAGANPLLVMLTGQEWQFILTPALMGALLIVVVAYAYHRWFTGNAYPKKWF